MWAPRVTLALTLVGALAVTSATLVSAPLGLVSVQLGLESTNAVRALLSAGRYDEAETTARALSKEAALAFGPNSREGLRAAVELVGALLENGRLDEGTLQFGRQVAELASAAGDPLLAARAATALGALLNKRGEADKGLPHLDRAAQLARDLNEVSLVAETAEHRASAMVALQRHDEARRAAEDAVATHRAMASPPARTAHALWVLALVERQAGRYDQARQALDEAQRLQVSLPPDHPDRRASTQLSGDLLFFDGEIAAAGNAWSSAVRAAEAALRPDHPDVAIASRVAAIAERLLGNVNEAEARLERARDIASRALPPCHPETSAITNDLAIARKDLGKFVDALAAYGEALTVRERCLGPNDQRTATVVHNLANLREELGDYAEAERLQRRAVRMWSAGLGADHPYVARGLDALADVVARRGRPAEARTLLERALDIRRRRLGPDHPDVGWTLTKLAELLDRTGDRRRARALIGEALAIHRASSSDDPDYLARSLALEAAMDLRSGNRGAAVVSLREAWDIRRAQFGDTHPLTASSLAELAAAEWAAGDSGMALRHALDAEQLSQRHVQAMARHLPDNLSLAYTERRARGLDLALSILAEGEVVDVSEVFEAVVRSRGIVLEEAAARARMASATTPSAAFQAVAAARRRVAALMLRSVRGDEVVPRSRVEDAVRLQEAAELDWARSDAGSDERRAATIGVREVVASLPSSTALVAFVRYDRSPGPNDVGGPGPTPRSAYIALVVSADRHDVAAIPIGSGATVGAAIARWRESVAAGWPAPGAEVSSERVSGGRLRRLVWDPLLPHLGDPTRVIIVPDGEVNLVSFAALPSGRTTYLAEDGPALHHVAAERDLLARQTAAAGLLAVGGVSFGAVPEPSTDGQRAGLTFRPLPATAAEIREVAAMFPGGETTTLSGSVATSEAFSRLAEGKRVVHVATHGFFLNAPRPAIRGTTRGVGGLTVGRRPARAEDDALLLSGLAFANANRAQRARAGQDDGVLTAEEVAGLNLQGTEWAVLSACDTGLGRVTTGEGVLGLRRAFQVAGARTVIMSLWSVDDDATRRWMRALYEGRLTKGLSTSESVQHANIAVLRERRAKKLSTHPFYWAAFVAAGDWR